MLTPSAVSPLVLTGLQALGMPGDANALLLARLRVKLSGSTHALR
jgi:hypothetical protein